MYSFSLLDAGLFESLIYFDVNGIQDSYSTEKFPTFLHVVFIDIIPFKVKFFAVP
jgi:hypothetical protein